MASPSGLNIIVNAILKMSDQQIASELKRIEAAMSKTPANINVGLTITPQQIDELERSISARQPEVKVNIKSDDKALSSLEKRFAQEAQAAEKAQVEAQKRATAEVQKEFDKEVVAFQQAKQKQAEAQRLSADNAIAEAERIANANQEAYNKVLGVTEAPDRTTEAYKKSALEYTQSVTKAFDTVDAKAKSTADKQIAEQKRATAEAQKEFDKEVAAFEKAKAQEESAQRKFTEKIGRPTGVTLPTGGGTSSYTEAIQGIQGFEEAYVRAVQSVQSGDQTFQRFNVTLDNADGGFDTFKFSVNEATGELYELDKGLSSTNTAFVRSQEGIDNMASAMAALFIQSGINQKLSELKQLLIDCADAAIKFESGVAGVTRTVGGTIQEVEALASGIQDLTMSIPISAESLLNLAENAGQLGIAREDILAFTEVMARLGTTTDISAESAGTLLAQFANITQLDPSQYENLASTLAFMGDASSATTRTISEMALRIAGAAEVAGIAEADIIGLSAAVGGLGIRTEAGGTAISRLIQELQLAVETGNGLEDFASVAGMSADNFAKAWGENATNALLAFISGLDDVERNGKSAIVILNDLGLSEQRLQRTLLSLATAGDSLSNSIKQSNTAWTDNTALMDKASIMYGTTESQTQLLANATDRLKVAVGDALLPTISGLTGGLAQMTNDLADFAEQNEAVIIAVSALGAGLATIVGIVSTYAAAMGILTLAKKAYAAATGVATVSTAAFSAAIKASPVGPIAIALGVIVTALGLVTAAATGAAASMEEARRQSEENIQTWNEEARSLETLLFRYEELNSQNTPQAREELVTLEQQLVETYKLEADAIDLVNGSLEANVEAINKAKLARLDQIQAETAAMVKQAQDTINGGARGIATVDVDPITSQVRGVTESGNGNTIDEYIESLKRLRNEISDTESDFASLGGSMRSEMLSQIDDMMAEAESEKEASLSIINSSMEVARQTSKLMVSESKNLTGVARQVYENIADGLTYSNENAEQYVSLLESYADKLSAMDATDFFDDLTAAYRDYENALNMGDNQAIIDTVDIIEDLKVKIEAAIGPSAILSEIFKTQFDTSGLEQVQQKLEELNNVSLQELNDQLEAFANATTASEKTFRESKVQEALEGIREAAEGGAISWEEYDAQVTRVGIALGDLPSVFEQVADNLADVESRFNTLIQAQDELNETGQITASTFQNLTDNNLIQYLEMVDGRLRLNIDAFLQDAEAARVDAIATLEEARAKDVLNIALGNLDAVTPGVRAAIERLGDSAIASGNKAILAAEGYNTLAVEALRAKSAIDNSFNDDVSQYTKTTRDQMAIANDYYDKQIAMISSIKFNPISAPGARGGGSGGSSRSAAEKEVEVYKAQVEAIKLLEAELERVNDLLGENQALINSGDITGVDAQSELYQQRIDLLKQQQEILHQINESRRGEMSGMIDQLGQYGIDITFNPQLNEITFNQTVEEMQDALNGLDVGDTEASNELRKELEDMLQTILDMNDANRDNGATWNEIAQTIDSIRFDELSLDFSNEINKNTEAIDDLDFAMSMTSPDDYTSKTTILTQKLNLQQQAIEMNHKRMAELNKALADGLIGPAEYAKGLDQLKSAMQDVSLAAVQTRNELKQLQITQLEKARDATMTIVEMVKDMIRTEVDNDIKAIEAEIDLIELEKDRLKDLEDDLQDSLKDRSKYYDQLRDDLRDQYDEQKRLNDETRKGLNDELKAYERIIAAKKRELDIEQEQRRYEQDINEQNRGISDIENRIAELSLNDSREAAAERSRLEEELAKLRIDLDNTVYDASVEKQKDALDQELARFKESIDEEERLLDEQDEEDQRRHEARLDRIDQQEENFREMIESQIEGLHQEAEAYDAVIEGKQQQIDALQDSISRNGELTLMAMDRISREGDAIYGQLVE